MKYIKYALYTTAFSLIATQGCLLGMKKKIEPKKKQTPVQKILAKNIDNRKKFDEIVEYTANKIHKKKQEFKAAPGKYDFKQETPSTIKSFIRKNINIIVDKISEQETDQIACKFFEQNIPSYNKVKEERKKEIYERNKNYFPVTEELKKKNKKKEEENELEQMLQELDEHCSPNLNKFLVLNEIEGAFNDEDDSRRLRNRRRGIFLLASLAFFTYLTYKHLTTQES